MKVSQHEQKEDNENVNILANEIKSCKDFEYALREESALLFNEMLSECGQNKDYIKNLLPSCQEAIMAFLGITIVPAIHSTEALRNM